MNIYIVRHAIAIERGTKGYEDDSKRPLTVDGIAKMREVSRGLRALKLSFDVILSSPYLRAKHTAEIVIQTFKTKQTVILTKNLTPDVPFKDLLLEINAKAKNKTSVLLVGHEPHLSGLISFLLDGQEDLSFILKKGGFCHLIAEHPVKPGSASLSSLLTPAQLRLIH